MFARKSRDAISEDPCGVSGAMQGMYSERGAWTDGEGTIARIGIRMIGCVYSKTAG